ncbi:MAG: phBC6A51 family helix-turn-helix protein [Negativicutes bacterium]|nr:phBC6A51 family helix-turn-helix protein [Negativicutes bacterium]
MPKSDVPEGPEMHQEMVSILSAEQIRGIQLLVAGKSDTEVAENIGKDRRTIFRWRQDPHFIAELNRQQKEVYESGQTRLHGLFHKAITVIENKLDEGNFKAAMEVLRLLNVTPKSLKPDFETDPEAIAAREAEKLAYSAITATPFAKENMGITAGRDTGLQALAGDIFAIIKEKYNVPTMLEDLAE